MDILILTGKSVLFTCGTRYRSTAFIAKTSSALTNSLNSSIEAALRGEKEIGVTGKNGLINQKIIDKVNTNQDRIQLEREY